MSGAAITRARSLSMIRILRAAGPLRRRGALPRQQQPDAIRLEYAKAIERLVCEPARDHVAAILRDVVADLERIRGATRTDEERAAAPAILSDVVETVADRVGIARAAPAIHVDHELGVLLGDVRGACAVYDSETDAITLGAEPLRLLARPLALARVDSDEDVLGVKVLVHEALHAASRGGGGAGAALAAIEEGSAEIGAQLLALEIAPMFGPLSEGAEARARAPLFRWEADELRLARPTSYPCWVQRIARLAALTRSPLLEWVVQLRALRGWERIDWIARWAGCDPGAVIAYMTRPRGEADGLALAARELRMNAPTDPPPWAPPSTAAPAPGEMDAPAIAVLLEAESAITAARSSARDVLDAIARVDALRDARATFHARAALQQRAFVLGPPVGAVVPAPIARTGARAAMVLAFDPAGRLLLGRRREGGTWTLPGGGLMPGESPRRAAARELAEEANLTAGALDLIADRTLRSGARVWFFRCTVTSGSEPTGYYDPDGEVAEWRYFDVTHGLPAAVRGALAGPTDPDENVLLVLFGAASAAIAHGDALPSASEIVGAVKHVLATEVATWAARALLEALTGIVVDAGLAEIAVALVEAAADIIGEAREAPAPEREHAPVTVTALAKQELRNLVEIEKGIAVGAAKGLLGGRSLIGLAAGAGAGAAVATARQLRETAALFDGDARDLGERIGRAAARRIIAKREPPAGRRARAPIAPPVPDLLRRGTRTVPIEVLDPIVTNPFEPQRLHRIRKAYEQGAEKKLPPITVVVGPDGSMSVPDGNHRLEVAREQGAETIRVKFARSRNRQSGFGGGLENFPERERARQRYIAKREARRKAEIGRVGAELKAAARGGEAERRRAHAQAGIEGVELQRAARAGERHGAMLDRAARRFAETLRPAELEDVAQRFGERTSKFQRAQLDRQLRVAVGVPYAAVERPARDGVDGWAAENVDLIKTIPERYFDRLRLTVEDAYAGGTAVDTLTRQIAEDFHASLSDARRIARDQVGKLNGQLNQARQESIGVTHYLWRGMRDNRERDNHVALEGRRCSWEAPPVGGGTGPGERGHPGSGIQCRCYPEPDLSAILGR